MNRIAPLHQDGFAASPTAALAPLPVEESYKNKAYAALKAAILDMDLYASPAPVMLDEREISERLGVSRTPIREAIAMLEQDGFVRALPRRGILVVRKSKREIIEMIQAWAALESMAVRLICQAGETADIARLRGLMDGFGDDHRPDEHLSEYSSANIAFHQALIGLARSQALTDMTSNLLLHVRGIRQLTIGRGDRARRSIADHRAIIDAIAARDTERAEKLARDHTLGLAAFVERHGEDFFESSDGRAPTLASVKGKDCA